MRAMNLVLAAICVALFSLTVPFTRIAALEMPPLLVMSLRLCGAGLLCAVLLGLERWLPPRRAWPALLLTAASGVLGFSLLTALALREVPGSHGALGLAALPAVTAAYAVFRDRVQPGWQFWSFAVLGTLLSFGYFFTQAAGVLYRGDLLLGLAVLSATLGYVEGGRLSREFGAVRVMCWAIVLTLPLATVLMVWQYAQDGAWHFSGRAWLSIAYLALVSQSVGMFLWYRVLARGPMEKVALIQLLQPFLTLLAALWLLEEQVGYVAWVLAALVVLCVFGANRSRSLVPAAR